MPNPMNIIPINKVKIVNKRCLLPLPNLQELQQLLMHKNRFLQQPLQITL